METIGRSSVLIFNNYLVPKQYQVHCLLLMALYCSVYLFCKSYGILKVVTWERMGGLSPLCQGEIQPSVSKYGNGHVLVKCAGAAGIRNHSVHEVNLN